MESLQTGNSTKDIKIASIYLGKGRPPILKGSYGEMDKKDLGRPDGLMMSSAGRWLTEERWFGITGAGILFSAFIISVIVGMVFVQWDRSHERIIYLNGRSYALAGLGEINDNGRKMYAPVYKEIK